MTDPTARATHFLQYVLSNRTTVNSADADWYTIMMGFAIGLRLSELCPEIAARIAAEIAAPKFGETLGWIAEGEPGGWSDPELPIH